MKKRSTERKPRGTASETREALLVAAADVFNTEGYFQTDTNRLARAAGYAPATFYKHFENKLEIFLATYQRWVASEWSDIADIIEHKGTITEVVSAVIGYHKRWRGFRRSLRALAATNDEVRAFQRGQRRAQMEFLPRLREQAGLPPLSDGEALALLLAFERICDAIADEAPEALGVAEPDMIAVLHRLLRGATHDAPASR